MRKRIEMMISGIFNFRKSNYPHLRKSKVEYFTSLNNILKSQIPMHFLGYSFTNKVIPK